jgi:hypothetical protein
MTRGAVVQMVSVLVAGGLIVLGNFAGRAGDWQGAMLCGLLAGMVVGFAGEVRQNRKPR